MTGARLDFPSPSGAREPPCGGDLEIKKAVFGFKRESKKFCSDLDRSAGALRPRGQGRLDGASLSAPTRPKSPSSMAPQWPGRRSSARLIGLLLMRPATLRAGSAGSR